MNTKIINFITTIGATIIGLIFLTWWLLSNPVDHFIENIQKSKMIRSAGKISQYPAIIYPAPKHPVVIIRLVLRMIEWSFMVFDLNVPSLNPMVHSLVNDCLEWFVNLPINDFDA